MYKQYDIEELELVAKFEADYNYIKLVTRILDSKCPGPKKKRAKLFCQELKLTNIAIVTPAETLRSIHIPHRDFEKSLTSLKDDKFSILMISLLTSLIYTLI